MSQPMRYNLVHKSALKAFMKAEKLANSTVREALDASYATEELFHWIDDLIDENEHLSIEIKRLESRLAKHEPKKKGRNAK